MDQYQTYDTTAGFGGPRQWRQAFRAAMGLDEARTVLGGRSPEELLGIAPGATWPQVVSAYRQRAMQWHPDRAVLNGLSDAEATERMKDLQAAFTVLEARYRR